MRMPATRGSIVTVSTAWTGRGRKGRGRRVAPNWRVARWLVLASCVWLAAPCAARAQGGGQTVIAHWPHSPVSHRLHHAAPKTTPSFSANLRGGFVTASNTLLTCPGNAVTPGERAARRRGHRAAEP